MLSEKAKELLQTFLSTLKEETGIEPTSIDLWQQKSFGNTSEEYAEELCSRFAMARTDYKENGYGILAKQSYDRESEQHVNIYYTFPISIEDEEDEEETEPFPCKECGDPVQENSDDENAEYCNVCFPIKVKEWKSEKHHEKSEYFSSVL